MLLCTQYDCYGPASLIYFCIKVCLWSNSSCLSLTDYMFSIVSFLVSVCVSLVSPSVPLLIPLHHFHHAELMHVSVFSQLVMVFTSCFILVVLCLLYDVFSCTCPLTRFCSPVPYFPRLCSLPLVRPTASALSLVASYSFSAGFSVLSGFYAFAVRDFIYLLPFVF